MKIIGIYKITSPTGRVYVGQSRDIEKRFKRYKAGNFSKQTKIENSVIKYGVENHTFEIIEECKLEDLNCRERHWQDHYDVLKEGLNCVLTTCGEKVRVVSEETKKRQSISMKGKLAGEKHFFFGKKRPTGLESTVGGKKWSKESKDKKRGENNPMFGKTGVKHPKFGYKTPENLVKLLKEKSSNIVLNVDTGIFYDSAKDAAIAYNINYGTLRDWLGRNSKNNKTSLIYV